MVLQLLPAPNLDSRYLETKKYYCHQLTVYVPNIFPIVHKFALFVVFLYVPSKTLSLGTSAYNNKIQITSVLQGDLYTLFMLRETTVNANVHRFLAMEREGR